MSEGLFFPQQVGSTQSITAANSYLNNSFQDYSLPATENVGFSSTISTNPMGAFFADDDSSKYFVKTLWIKDMVLQQDRSLWFQGGKTYNVQFTEDFSGVEAFASGAVGLNFSINGKSIRLSGLSSFFSVSGNILRVSFIVKPKVVGAANSIPYIVDGTISTTVQYTGFCDEDFGTVAGSLGTYNFINDQNKYFLVDDGVAQTNDLHTYSIKSTGDAAPATDGVLEVLGIVVYLSSDQSNVHVNPGNTYVNKSLVTTGTGSTLALPALGSSFFHLGAKTTYYKTAGGAVQASTYQVPLMQTVATGLSGQNTLTVSTGTGASYPKGTGIVVQSGTSFIYQIVTNRSTDTLTVKNNHPFTFTSATLTKAFFCFGESFPVGYTAAVAGSTQYSLAYSWNPALTYGASNWSGDRPLFTNVGITGFQGYTAVGGVTTAFGTSIMPYQAYYDPENRYAVFPTVGVTQGGMAMVDGVFGWQGQLSIRGDFQAIEFEYYISTSLNNQYAAIDGIDTSINGLVKSSTLPNYVRYCFAKDLGIGNHSVFLTVGNAGSTGAVLTGVNFYKYLGNSLQGKLSSIEQLQKSIPVATGNNTTVPGTFINNTGEFRFYGSDKLTFAGSWIKNRDGGNGGSLSTTPGFAECIGNSTNSTCTFKYWGNTFAAYTSNNGGSFVATLDGVSVGITSVNLNAGGSLAEHTLAFTFKSGTFGIQGIGIYRPYGELTCEQKFVPIQELSEIDGTLIKEKSVSVRRARQRSVGISMGIGGVAISPLITNNGAFVLGPTLIASIYLETSGNPVLFGLCQSNNFAIPGGDILTLAPSINMQSGVGGTGPIMLNLLSARVAQGVAAEAIIGNPVAPIGASIPGIIASWFYQQPSVSAGLSGSVYNTPALQKDLDLTPAGKWQYQLYGAIGFSGNGSSAFLQFCRFFAMELF